MALKLQVFYIKIILMMMMMAKYISLNNRFLQSKSAKTDCGNSRLPAPTWLSFQQAMAGGMTGTTEMNSLVPFGGLVVANCVKLKSVKLDIFTINMYCFMSPVHAQKANSAASYNREA